VSRADALRLFFALWPPENAALALHAWASAAQGACGGRVTRAESIHLTLAFLGEVPPRRMPAALAAAHRVRGGSHTVSLDEAGYWQRNRIVWAGAREAPGALARLAEALGAELRAEGFALERRPFAAHVTLIRKARDAGALPELRPVEWPVGEFVLVRSLLSSAGSRYEPLERFALA
jgi:2'-5' RNA ligase